MILDLDVGFLDDPMLLLEKQIRRPQIDILVQVSYVWLWQSLHACFSIVVLFILLFYPLTTVFRKMFHLS